MNAAQGQLREGMIVGDHFQIEGLLGIGDLGDTYTCRDLGGSAAKLVVKILRLAPLAPEVTDSLSREFSLLQRVRHPNLVRILDFGVIDSTGEVFLVEERIGGQDLYSGTDGMHSERVLNLMMELSSGLQYLHARGIVHGDLKPSNAILSQVEEGREKIKLLDFGLRRWSPNVRQQSGYGMLEYTAPEILMGEQATEASDMYALGILTYQLLARRLPFEDEDPGFLVQKHLQGNVDLRPIERLRNGESISELIRGFLDKDPQKRPSSGEEAARLFGNILGQDCSGVDVKELENHFSALQFVGREKEMAFLRERARHVIENGRGRTVFITGEAGSGKTRCMEELRSWALLKGWRVIEGACGVREEASYEPYRQILAATEPTKGQLIFRFSEPPRIADSGAFDSSSEYAAGQFRDLLTRELVRRITERPTMLFLHDFHRADEATNTVLDYLSSDIQAHPVLMCVSFRSGEETKGILRRVMDLAVRQDRGEVLALEPLAKDSVRQLVSEMTGDSELLGDWIFRSVGGNPFFLEEMLKHLVEQGILHRKMGQWKFLRERLKKLEIPASVMAVLQRRIEQLPPRARELANWLALFHRAVSKKLLSNAFPKSVGSIAEALQDLGRRQMIRMEIKEGDEIIGFSHDLVAEVIRSELPKRLRQRMHRKIAQVLEREYGAQGHLHELAIHYIEGKSKSESVRHVLASASQFRAEFAHENALRCFDYVFKNRNSLTREELCTAAIEASNTLFALGMPKRAVYLLKTEMRKNKTVGSDLKARMFMQLALSYQHLGDLHMQEVCCKRGLRIFRNRPGNEANITKASLWAELIFGAVLQSRPRRGLIYLNKALQSCADLSDVALAGRIHGLSGFLHRVACNLRQALVAGRRAVVISSRSGESYLNCSAYSTLGGILTALGRFPLALEKHRQAVSLSEESRSAILKSQALGNLAECLCRMGRTQEALNAAERALKSVCESNNPAISYAFDTILAEVKLSAADYRGARQVIEKLGHEAGPNLAFMTLGHAYYVAACLCYALGDFTGALKRIERLCSSETREAPFYEHELAEALRARILCERGLTQKALSHLCSLDRAVARKHWPYHMCVIKLHICEILIKERRMETAVRHAKNALRLAKAMQAIPLISHGHLLLGLIYSPLRCRNGLTESCSRTGSTTGATPLWDKAIMELERCCRMTEATGPAELAWRAHAELSLIFRALANTDCCLAHGKKAYELLCRLEDRVPSEMLPGFYGAFGRSHAKLELIRLIEASSDQGGSQSTIVRQASYDNESARILLRLSTTVNSIRELNPLLEAILDQLIPALDAERAVIFLRDQSTGKLELAKGKNNRRESLSGVEASARDISKAILAEGRPIISANARADPRIRKESAISDAPGKLLCAPLKASGRVMGVLYADHSSPVEGLSESAINLFAAFSNLAAVALDNALTHQHQAKERTELEQYLRQAREGYRDIVGKSAPAEALRNRIGMAAASPLDILITGESGTGKELVARAIYRTGRRKSEKFVPVDCGSLSDSLAEAELFGYRRGAFTGAAENRQGLLEAAQGGIIFLDEISNLPFQLQAKLLRVLQEREVRRIGETAPRKIDVQVIAATNRDLLEEMRAGRFRSDLFYRLKAMEIRVPPLRERREDIPLLIEWFLKKTSESEGGRSKRFTTNALELLKEYSYPGNIRELKNIVAGSYYSTTGACIGLEELPPEVRREDIREIHSELSAAGRVYREILEGKGSFEDLVKEPFLKRQFGSSMVRGVIEKALKDAGGRYRDAFMRLRIPDRRYSVTIQFLKRHKCYLDFRPFRRTPEKPVMQH